ncbi:3',5'-cyclic-nucleotide phosphodiesterase [Cryptotrichosporon argae]
MNPFDGYSFSPTVSMPISPPPTTDEEDEDDLDPFDDGCSFGSYTMASPVPPPAPGAPLSILVLLPDSAHSTQLESVPSAAARAARPSPLTSRQSGSTVPTTHASAVDDDVFVAQSRRLSLAPGMGGGTQTQTPTPPKPSARIALGKLTPAVPEDAAATPTQSAAPAFGAKRDMGSASSTGSPRSRRRPQTAVAAPGYMAPPVSRASVALGSGVGLSASIGHKNRPGWEGDEVVGVLRGAGLEVTIIRHASHLPTILSAKAESPTYPSFAPRPATLASQQAQHVVLVPLGDSPTLPSLSLLLAKGTTPTAVCFQQDLLDRARRVEDEWLPSATEAIKHIVQMRDRSLDADAPLAERPVILAYSANPGLTPSVITACVDAGAAGVLRPPYDYVTSRLLQRMVAAARQGRVSSVVGYGMTTAAPPGSPLAFSGPFGEDDPRVILTPTALSRGAEHEGEKILSAAVHKRGMSASLSSRGVPGVPVAGLNVRYERNEAMSPTHTDGRVEPALSTASSASVVTPTSASQPRAELPSPPYAGYDPLAAAVAYERAESPRRRSIDTGGLALAVKRAAKRFESVPALPSGPAQDAYHFPATPQKQQRHKLVAGDEEQAAAEGKGKAMFAELLGDMYRQTITTIDVQMAGDYEALAAPMSTEHRNRLIAELETWNFKPHKLDDADLFRCSCLLFEAVLCIDGVAELGIHADQMNRLLFAIRAIYHAPNPYHNYVHAVDVLQATYSFLVGLGVAPNVAFLKDHKSTAAPWRRPTEEQRPVLGQGTRRARQVLRPQDVLGVLIAAMGHDVGHPGLSNAFMKNAKTPLSQVYEDKSVLENMHCMLIVQLLRKHGFGFLLGQTSATGIPARDAIDARGFRHVLYSSVLATDMSLHFAWIQDLKEFGEAMRGPAPGARDELVEDDRIMICQALIKCADISNPTRPIDVSEHWSTVLLDEWAKQASLEQELCLPVSVVAFADARLQAKGQVGFIDLFTQPLFEATSDAFPELQAYADTCAENRNIWQSRLDALEADSQSGAPSRPISQVQPAPFATDDRFRTLFPLSLPASIVAAHAASTPTRPQKPNLGAHGLADNAVAVEPPTPEDAGILRAVYHTGVAERVHPLILPGIIGLDGARRMSHPDPLLPSQHAGRA